jgi:hypothetical protein
MRWFSGGSPHWWCSSGGLPPLCGGSLDPPHGSDTPRMRRCHCSVTRTHRCGRGTETRRPRKGLPPISWPLEWQVASTTVWRCHSGVWRPGLVGRTASRRVRAFQVREDKVARQFARCHVAPRPHVPDRYFIPYSPSGQYTPPPSPRHSRPFSVWPISAAPSVGRKLWSLRRSVPSVRSRSIHSTLVDNARSSRHVARAASCIASIPRVTGAET